jgi:acetoin utilization deacetylase AcuC-like enzyme
MQIVSASQSNLFNPAQIVNDNGTRYDYLEVPSRAEELLKVAKNFGQKHECLDRGLDAILAVHDPEYVAYLQNISKDPELFKRHIALFAPEAPLRINEYEFPTDSASTTLSSMKSPAVKNAQDDFTPIMPDTWDAIYWSAQCAIEGSYQILEKGGLAYSLCRPPGHHATKNSFGGYCFFNNAAIAAKNLSRFGKVAILDIDAHHGNGTQEIFYEDPKVFFCSIHGDPSYAYPFKSGYASETGKGAGEGTNLNIPLRRGVGEEEYLAGLKKGLEAIAKFKPDYLVISAGLDICSTDPNYYFNITTSGLTKIAGMIDRILRSSVLPTLIVQEGGYDLKNLKSQLSAFLSGFQDMALKEEIRP